ncbi:hypothetical protein K7X08_008442 [Anisodus acutangulus]|uniref:Uncharacterized protein n=1 Tax=Anisodus acutangulus TaxID=402998 RepID=A0A9Q1RPC1_9SOLA|nr:hypothetical protein K7X08_008442 [Anisodus acutangulus]
MPPSQICGMQQRGGNPMLLSLLQTDSPESAIIFVTEQQSEKSKKTGSAPTTLLVDFLRSCGRFSDVSLLEEDMNFNQQAASLSVSYAEMLLLSGGLSF